MRKKAPPPYEGFRIGMVRGAYNTISRSKQAFLLAKDITSWLRAHPDENADAFMGVELIGFEDAPRDKDVINIRCTPDMLEKIRENIDSISSVSKNLQPLPGRKRVSRYCLHVA